MNARRTTTLAGALLMATLCHASANAEERVPAEQREYPYSASLPACDDQGVLNKISGRLSGREFWFWSNDLSITDVKEIRMVGFRPNGPDLIPRRYCHAAVVTSDNQKRVMDYNIIEDAGIIGWGYGVEWCISGLERNYSHDGDCRTARP
jgi:hypothetical protein